MYANVICAIGCCIPKRMRGLQDVANDSDFMRKCIYIVKWVAQLKRPLNWKKMTKKAATPQLCEYGNFCIWQCMSQKYLHNSERLHIYSLSVTRYINWNNIILSYHMHIFFVVLPWKLSKEKWEMHTGIQAYRHTGTPNRIKQNKIKRSIGWKPTGRIKLWQKI